MKIRFIFIIFALICLTRIHCEYYTALAGMESLLGVEAVLSTILNNYIQEETTKLKRMQEFLEHIKSYHSNKYNSSEQFLSNPLNALLLLKRFRVDWPTIYDNFDAKSQQKEQFLARYKIYNEFSYLPTHEDFIGAVAALMRLKDTYDLNIGSIANGVFNGVQYDVELSANDCLEIGKVFYNDEDFLNSVKWFRQAFSKMTNTNLNTKVDILDYLSYSLYKTDDLNGAIELTQSLLKLSSNHTRAINNLKIYLSIRQQKSSKRKYDDGSWYLNDETDISSTKSSIKTKDNLEDFKLYKKLCRQKVTMPKHISNKLTCYYENRNEPYLRIGPFQVEEAYHKPKILIFHNVMYDNEIEVIKELAKPKFQRATVQNAITGELEVADYRISKSAWLKNEDDPIIERVCQRISMITGLNLDTAEELQIVNYGIGGHYEPHFDFARKDEKRSFESLGTGNRIATVLFYMSDVEQGGATVFPYIKTALWPKKGSAAFWYNLYPSGQGDYLTRHAACPVLVGSKWVANKWIHFVGQELIRPCNKSLDENELKGYTI